MTIAIVGSVAAENTGTGTALATAPQNHTTGNSVLVFARWEGSLDATTLAVADTAGNTYSEIEKIDADAGENHSAAVYWSNNITGHASNIITTTLGANRTFRKLIVVEISHTSAVSHGTPATARSDTNTGTFSTSDQSLASGDTVFTYGTHYNSGGTMSFDGSDYTLLQGAQSLTILGYHIASGASTLSTSGDHSSDDSHNVITFKVTEGGGGGGGGGSSNLIGGVARGVARGVCRGVA